MKKFIVAFLLICGTAFAADRTVVIPENVTDQEAKEWMAILQERKTNATVEKIPEVVAAVAKAKVDIDTYRKAVGLAPKFEKVAEPIEEPKPIEG
jgi:hypothetical protein